MTHFEFETVKLKQHRTRSIADLPITKLFCPCILYNLPIPTHHDGFCFSKLFLFLEILVKKAEYFSEKVRVNRYMSAGTTQAYLDHKIEEMLTQPIFSRDTCSLGEVRILADER